MKSTASSKISGTIIKEDLRRFWPVQAITLLILLMTGIIPLLLSRQGRRENLSIISHWTNVGSIGFNVAFVVAAITAGIVTFRYLENRRASDFTHSRPLTRETLFVSNFLAGVIMMAVPVILNAVFMVMIGGLSTALPACRWICVSMLICLVIYSITVFAGMVCGNTPMHVFCAFLFNAFAILVIITLKLYFGQFLYGYSYDDIIDKWVMRSTPVTAFFGNFEIGTTAAYIVVFVLFTVFAYLLYKRRPVERTGESILFRWMRTFLIMTVTFGGMTIVGFLFFFTSSGRTQGLSFELVIGLVIGFIVSFVIMSLMLFRTVKIFNRKNMMTALITAVICVVFIGCMQLDVTGYSSRIPERSNVATAAATVYPVMMDSDSDSRFDASYFKGYSSENATDQMMVFTSTKNIDDVYALQKIIVSAKSENMKSDSDIQFEMSYSLKNGKTMTRSYKVSEDTYKSMKPYMARLYESTEFKDFFSLSNLKKKVTGLTYSKNDDMEYDIGASNYKVLMKALDKDFASRTFSQESDDESGDFYINTGKGMNSIGFYVAVKPSDKYTKAWISAHKNILQ